MDCGAAVVCVAKRFAGAASVEVAANSEVGRIGGANYYWCFDENYFELVDFEVYYAAEYCAGCATFVVADSAPSYAVDDEPFAGVAKTPNLGRIWIGR